MKAKSMILLGATAGIIIITGVISGQTFAEDSPSNINPNPDFSEQQKVTPEEWVEMEKKVSTIGTEFGDFRRDDTFDYSKLEDSEISHDDTKINASTKVIVEEHGIFVK